MIESSYVVRPIADRDPDEQTYFYATEASPEVGHRFLVAWQFRLRYPDLKLLRVFRVKGFERILIVYLPSPAGVEIVRVVHGSRNLQAVLRSDGVD